MGFKSDKQRKKVMADLNGHSSSHISSGSSPATHHSNSNKMLNNSSLKLVNRASVGIRAYTDRFPYKGHSLVLEIGTHHPWGKYLVEPYWEHQGTEFDPITIETNNLLSKKKFDTFEEAKQFIESEFGYKIVLDKSNSNDYQSWEQNIKQTDHELPYDKKFWSLPEHIKNHIGEHGNESTEEFLKRYDHGRYLK